MLSGSENKNTNACHLLNTFKHNIWVVTNLFQLTLPIFEQKKNKRLNNMYTQKNAYKYNFFSTKGTRYF